MGTDLVATSSTEIAEEEITEIDGIPAIVIRGGGPAAYAWEEFFARDNSNTNATYRIAVTRFVWWAQDNGHELDKIRPGHISQYIKQLLNLKTGKPLSDKSRKVHLTAIRQLFDNLVLRHAVSINPAASVKGPKETSVESKTPAVPADKVKHVLAACDTSHVVGLRDRAIIRVLAFTGVRRGAVAGLRLKDFYDDGEQHTRR